jgi:hypothetical protein
MHRCEARQTSHLSRDKCRMSSVEGVQWHCSMTAKEALDAVNEAEPGERLRRYETTCGPRGACRREPLTNDAGRWTFCPDCLAVYDDYGKAVIAIPEFGRTH